MALLDDITRGLLLGALGVTLVGCGEKTCDSGDPECEDTGDTEDTEDTDTEPQLKSPRFAEFSMNYAYNADTDKAVPFSIQGNPVPVNVEVLIWTDAWSYGDYASDEYCMVTLTAGADTEFDQPSWLADEGAYFGLDIATGSQGTTDCDDTWDLAAFQGDIVGSLSTISYSSYVGPLSASVEAEIKGQVENAGQDWSQYQPYLLGAGIKAPELGGDFGNYLDTWTFAWGVDENMDTAGGAEDRLEASEFADGTFPSAMVSVSFGVQFTAQ